MRKWTIMIGLMMVCRVGAQAEPRQGRRGAKAELEHRSRVEVHYDSRQYLEKGVTLAQLSNGLTVIVAEHHAAPVATVRCFVKNTGSAFEKKYLGAGISHLVEHLVAGGSTSKRSEQEIRDIIDTLGGQTNAFTSNDVTAYYINCPAKNSSTAIELIAESMQFAVFEEDEYRREMGVVQRELEMGENERSRVGYQAMKSLVFTTHPMRHPIIGYLPVLQKISRKDVIDFYSRSYVPQNMVFVVVGDIQTEKILAEVLDNFQGFERTTEWRVDSASEPEQVSPRRTRIQMEGETVQLSLAWPTVPLQDPDLYPLDVASFILTNGDSSRLVRRLKIDSPLAISASGASYTPGFVKGWFEIEVECEPENSETCRQIILEEIERLRTEPVETKELAKAKRQVAAMHVFGQQTVADLAGSFGSSYLSTGDPLFDLQYVAGIQTVTAEQIKKVARKYFQPQRLNTVVIEPIAQTDSSVAQSDNQSADSPIIKKTLANGLTVLLKRNAVLPLVTVQAFVRGGATSDTSTESGLASLAAEMMTKGTQKYTGVQIAEYFDSIGGSIKVASQRNTSYLQCLVLAGDFEKTLDHTYQVLFEPTFPAEEFAKVQQIRLGQIAARKSQSQAEIMDFWAQQLPSSSPYSRTAFGTQETVAGLTAENCKKFHQTFFVPNNMVLAIFGDIDPEVVLEKIEASFARVPKSEDFQWPTFPKVGSLSANIKKHLQTQKENTAMVLLSYPTVNIYDEKTQSTIEVLQSILTGGSGRLHEELRGERLVYYVFGFQMTGWAPGFFLFLAQTRPETVGEVVGRIESNLRKIRKEGIPAEEFARVKAKLLAAHAMKNTTPASQAFQAALDELYGLGYDYGKSYDQRIAAVRSQDVVELIEKHFVHSVLVTSSPKSAPNLAQVSTEPEPSGELSKGRRLRRIAEGNHHDPNDPSDDGSVRVAHLRSSRRGRRDTHCEPPQGSRRAPTKSSGTKRGPCR